MVVLCDTSLRQLCEEGMLENYDDKRIGPASIDLRLGVNILREFPQHSELVRETLEGTFPHAPFWMMPQEFLLAETMETLHIPDDFCAQFILRSSCARAGLQHLQAGFVDPGFNNSVLTLELKNVRRVHPVAIWEGMPIGQLVVMRMDRAPARSYREVGRYNGYSTVTPNKGIS